MSKKKIALLVLGVLLLLLGILAGIVATRPAEFSISRSIVIDAPADRIFPYLNDVRKGMEWSPFEKLDPDMKREFSGPQQGVGAIYAWDGDSNAGQGRITILESEPNQRVRLQLDFIRPFNATNDSEYRIEPTVEDQNRVTWTMSGRHNFLGKAICMMMDMDKMVGGMFEEGLANLKTLAEKDSVSESVDAVQPAADQ